QHLIGHGRISGAAPAAISSVRIGTPRLQACTPWTTQIMRCTIAAILVSPAAARIAKVVFTGYSDILSPYSVASRACPSRSRLGELNDDNVFALPRFDHRRGA